jgi:hypothetical protein
MSRPISIPLQAIYVLGAESPGPIVPGLIEAVVSAANVDTDANDNTNIAEITIADLFILNHLLIYPILGI